MEPSSSDPAYLEASNAAIFGAMQAANPNSIYLMQVRITLEFVNAGYLCACYMIVIFDFIRHGFFLILSGLLTVSR